MRWLIGLLPLIAGCRTPESPPHAIVLTPPPESGSSLYGPTLDPPGGPSRTARAGLDADRPRAEFGDIRSPAPRRDEPDDREGFDEPPSRLSLDEGSDRPVREDSAGRRTSPSGRPAGRKGRVSNEDDIPRLAMRDPSGALGGLKMSGPDERDPDEPTPGLGDPAGIGAAVEPGTSLWRGSSGGSTDRHGSQQLAMADLTPGHQGSSLNSAADIANQVRNEANKDLNPAPATSSGHRPPPLNVPKPPAPAADPDEDRKHEVAATDFVIKDDVNYVVELMVKQVGVQQVTIRDLPRNVRALSAECWERRGGQLVRDPSRAAVGPISLNPKAGTCQLTLMCRGVLPPATLTVVLTVITP